MRKSKYFWKKNIKTIIKTYKFVKKNLEHYAKKRIFDDFGHFWKNERNYKKEKRRLSKFIYWGRKRPLRPYAIMVRRWNLTIINCDHNDLKILINTIMVR
jgi:hypothetical protein